MLGIPLICPDADIDKVKYASAFLTRHPFSDGEFQIAAVSERGSSNWSFDS